MPSNNDPQSSVAPGPGKLPVGTVPSSALLIPSGGGSFAALEAHITNPHDAHLAHAIGVDPFFPYPDGTQPILSSAGGVVDGESVLDFINQFKDLIPARPNSIGFNLAGGITSGIPNWNALASLTTGGYQQGSNVQFSHFLMPNGTTSTGSITGLLYPGDRGVIAFYKNASGNFLDGSSTLVAALSLNDTAPDPSIPNAAFNETLRHAQQANYTPTNSGLDFFTLTFRLPYLTSYAAYPGTPYGPFSQNFYSYQLASFSLAAQAITAGNAQNLLIVHWKETYATSLASIQPAALTLANLTANNCYSATPSNNVSYTSGSWDDSTQAAFNVNRHFIFLDTHSGTGPSGSAFTSSPNGSPATVFLSGVKYYNVASGGGALAWTVDIQALNLFANTFLTGSSDNPPNVPTGFHSASDPIQLDFTNFGGGILPVPYYAMKKSGGSAYTATNSPAPGDTGEYANAALSIFTPAPFCPVGGFAQLTADLRSTYQETTYIDTNKYLFDSYPQTGAGTISTATSDQFVDEYYRYSTTFDPTPSAAVSLVPSGGNVFLSATALASGGPDLQVVGQELVYPQTNYNVASFLPAQTPNYSGFPGSDGGSHLRRYLRAFDTGLARNTGILRIRGISQASFTQDGTPYNGAETTGHLTGGAIVQLKVPGASGTDWLDLGLGAGSPGLVGPVGTTPFYGCSTGVIVSGSDIYVSYNTTAFTSNNGSVNFLLFVRVTFINGTGTSLVLSEIRWLPPGTTIPSPLP